MKKIKIKKNFVKKRRKVTKGEKLFDLEILSLHFNTWHGRIIPIYADRTGILSFKQLSEKTYTEFETDFNSKKIIESLIKINNKKDTNKKKIITKKYEQLNSKTKNELKNQLSENSKIDEIEILLEDIKETFKNSKEFYSSLPKLLKETISFLEIEKVHTEFELIDIESLMLNKLDQKIKKEECKDKLENIEICLEDNLLIKKKHAIIETSYTKLGESLNLIEKEIYGGLISSEVNPNKEKIKNSSSKSNNYSTFQEGENKIRNIYKNHRKETNKIIQTNQTKSTKKTFYKQLDDLIGLIEVKEKVTELIDLTKIQAERQKIGLKNMTTNKNMIFQGPPGTCKTTVARIIGEIFHSLGLLSKKKFVEVDKGSLVAEYVGQTAVKTTAVIEKAKGGVLFIDEAYSLLDCDFGKESITTILKFMEDNREDLVVIIAGYKEPMQKFINSNPGLKSRFSNLIDFPHYSQQELVEIFKYQSKLNNYKLSENASIQLNPVVANIYKSKDENFGNGRSMRNLLDISIKKHASRLINQKKKTNFWGSTKKLSLEDLSTLRGVDIQLSKEEIKYVA